MFRFTIRDVLWLTVVVAVFVSWWVDRDRLWHDADRNRAVVNRFKAVGIEPEPFLTEMEKVAPAPAKVASAMPSDHAGSAVVDVTQQSIILE